MATDVNATDANVYTNMQAWQKDNQQVEDLYIHGAELQQKALMTGDIEQRSIFQQEHKETMAQYEDMAADVPIFFDMLEGEDVEEYDNKLKELAFGELFAKDADESGTVSYEEYALAKLADLEENASEEEILDTLVDSYYLFNGINKATKKGDDGEISAAELAFFYKNMDKADGFDGFIDYGYALDYVENIADEGKEKLKGNIDTQRIDNLFQDVMSN